ncbi:hypothetical protein [Pararhodobacter oceanensis]|uniref:hypothetical protein n=1 Tax=Pararhodobacter oceanensis TaxID=2172121 RepID=UPI003A92E765
MLLKFPTATAPADPQLAIARRHFDRHAAGLCNAAELIDGISGRSRVLRLISALREASRLDRTIRHMLVDLHRLLALDPVIGGFEPDLSFTCLLDPASPEVEELCLITDRLYDLLVDIGERDEKRDAIALRAQDSA